MTTYAATAADGTQVTWRDPKRYLWLLGLLVPALPFLAIGLHAALGGTTWLRLGPIVFFGVVPVIDLLAGRDGKNPPEEVLAALEADRYYRWVTYLYLPLQYAGFVVGIWYLARPEISVAGKVGLSLTLGTVAGVAINTAHELGHKRDKTERWLAKIALAQCAYGHFYVEHNRGHHVRVATPPDPASARYGESLYLFWPRTVFGSLRSAWESEHKRLSRKDGSTWRVGNDVLNAWAMTVVLWAALIGWLGLHVVPYLLLQAVFGFTLLEVVNYVEHYGLLRQKVKHGEVERYERVEPRHSWNSNNTTTNVLLYHLQRHSDHHANPTRRYQSLRDFAEAPVLPTGYTGMILLALFPPLFRRVMDPRVSAHYGGDLSLANLRTGMHVEPMIPVARPAEPGDAVDAARCPGCGYTYEVAAGDEAQGFPAGTRWSEIPDDWHCPDCGVRDKVDFVPVTPAEV